MSESTRTRVQVGPGIFGLLTIVFVIAKLTGHLDWSWWWVFSPLWLPWAVILSVLVIIGLCAGSVAVMGAIFDRAAHKPKTFPRRRQ